MSSTGSVSASPNDLLMALIQYPVPVVNHPDDVQRNVDEICRMVASTKASYPDLDLIVFPEYSSSGLNTRIWSYDEFLIGWTTPRSSSTRPPAATTTSGACSPSWSPTTRRASRRSTPPS